MSFLAVIAWYYVAPSDVGYWYPEILALALLMATVTYLLKYLYEAEE